MNSFPLVRVKMTNEHIMAVLFLVLGLYHLPVWINRPAAIFNFFLMLITGLLLDTVLNFIRYRKPICAVSTAVTVAMISVLTNGIPLVGQLLAVVTAVLLGKQIWGGTGKNIINPAVTGLLFAAVFYNVSYPPFSVSWLLVLALLLSLPFLRFRPWSGTGYMLGMIIAIFIGGDSGISSILSSGVIFWGCLVLTDPVSVTRQPIPGFILSLTAGFLALFNGPSLLSIGISIIIINLLSYMIDRIIYNKIDQSRKSYKPGLRIKRSISVDLNKKQCIDLTDKDNTQNKGEIGELSSEEILKRIKNRQVFGFGGAGFSTYRKLKTVMDAEVSKKHLIINAVECDPGLIHDKWLLHNFFDEIYQGINIVSRCLEFNSITLALKDTDDIKSLDCSLHIPVQISTIEDYFPVGAEKILISEILNKNLSSDEIPAEYGILVLNVQTIYAIYRAVVLNEEIDSRFITVANLLKNETEVVKVSLGAGIKQVIDTVYPGNNNPIFSGGGIMQSSLVDDTTVIDKKVNFLAIAEFPRYKESLLCSKCGICSSNCPAGLAVNIIADLVDQDDIESTFRYQVEKCLECGSCSYSCLAGRNLAARIKTAKKEMLKAAI